MLNNEIKVTEKLFNETIEAINKFYNEFKNFNLKNCNYLIQINKAAYGYILKVKFDEYIFTFHYFKAKDNYYLNGIEYNTQDSSGGFFNAIINSYQKFKINPNEIIDYLRYISDEIIERYNNQEPKNWYFSNGEFSRNY